MIRFSEPEKAIILLGLSSVAEADSYGYGPNEKEIEFAQFILRFIRPTQNAYQLVEKFIQNPISAYSQIKNAPIDKKRKIKTLFVYMCTCDGPINEGEQQALKLLDKFCDFPFMSMEEVENEYNSFGL